MMSLDLSDRLGMKTLMIIGVAISLIFFALLPPKISAQIKTDGTVGPAQSLNGPNYLIPQRLGTTSGQNLFHSFEKFGLTQSESATFTGADTIENVISRVTDGQVSSIDGLLRSEVGKADFFFINPAGVVFGPNAQVDVPAAFHVSTADELRFGDGNVFSAADSEKSTLTMAEPVSFGYLGPQSASVVLNGSKLTFAPEIRVSVGGGNVTLDNGSSMVSEGGEIQVTAVGKSQFFTDLMLGESKSSPDGQITISESSKIDVSGIKGYETVKLRAGCIKINDSIVAADHTGDGNATGQIRMEAKSINVSDSEVHAHVYAAGTGNDIVVNAESLEINRNKTNNKRSYLATRVKGDAGGDAGNINISVGRLTLLNGGQIASVSEKMTTGNSGSIFVGASEKIIVEGYDAPDRYSGVYSITDSEEGADGGSILIKAPNAFVGLKNGGRVQCGTYGSGAAGTITIEANNVQILDDGELTEDGGIWNGSQGDGHAGDIIIKASDAITLDRSAIINVSLSKGNAGYISLAGEEIIIDNGSVILADVYDIEKPGNIIIDSKNSLTIRSNSYIEAAKIWVRSSQLEIRSGAVIDSSTFVGDAGIITVESNNMIIDGDGVETGIFTDVISGSGGGGNIFVTLSEGAELLSGAQISSNTSDEGDAGDITIKAAKMMIDGGGKEQTTRTGIFSETWLDSGNGGEINVKVSGQLDIMGGGNISTDAVISDGKAGKITVAANKILIDGRDQILVTGISSGSKDSSGQGGDVKVLAKEMLSILNGGVINTSVIQNSGDSGTIFVDAGQILIDGSEAGMVPGLSFDSKYSTGIFSETAGSLTGDLVGKGGKIKLRSAGLMKLKSGGQISTSSSYGGADAGSITIEAADLVIMNKGSEIVSEANFGSRGNAGDITIGSDNFMITESGAISTSTQAMGNAGMVTIRANNLLINGNGLAGSTRISSLAAPSSMGNVGNIEIIGHEIKLEDSGEVTIEGAQAIAENKLEQHSKKQIIINSESLSIKENSLINASSTGNAPAASIEIRTNNLELSGNSSIITSSKNADGGPISINGEICILRDGFITTSVEGLNGNGGNIKVGGMSDNPSKALILEGGFIQANTAAEGARGGDIFIDAKAIIAESGLLEVGGLERQTFEAGGKINVIQAAAPGGEQGAIAITAPSLDISGNIVNLVSGFSNPFDMAIDPCRSAADGSPNSLILCGRGGSPPGPDFPSTTVLWLKPAEFNNE